MCGFGVQLLVRGFSCEALDCGLRAEAVLFGRQNIWVVSFLFDHNQTSYM